jgi:hypothetical protein
MGRAAREPRRLVLAGPGAFQDLRLPGEWSEFQFASSAGVTFGFRYGSEQVQGVVVLGGAGVSPVMVSPPRDLFCQFDGLAGTIIYVWGVEYAAANCGCKGGE